MIRAKILQNCIRIGQWLISVISHDYHTLLVSLKKYLDIAGNYNITPDERRILESEIRQSVVNTQNLLINLLDMTKSGVQRPDIARYPHKQHYLPGSQFMANPGLK